jgi:hypothetical protein
MVVFGTQWTVVKALCSAGEGLTAFFFWSWRARRRLKHGELWSVGIRQSCSLIVRAPLHLGRAGSAHE